MKRGGVKTQQLHQEDNETDEQEEFEAVSTWNVGKTIGLRTADDGRVVQQLRRSQRKVKGG